MHLLAIKNLFECESFVFWVFPIYPYDSEDLVSTRRKTAFTRCRHNLKTVKNVTDRPSVHTKTAHFLQVHFENGRF